MKFFSLKNLEKRRIVPGHYARFIHTEHLTFAYWEIKAGSSVPSHSHPHEQVVNMIEGKYQLTVDGVSATMVSGDVAIVPPNAAHTGTAITDCHVIDVFYPIREDCC
jgi:quercetin dioxygenase-like cupin family protein